MLRLGNGTYADYIIFTHQLEKRAQQMGPLLITTSTCSKGESGGLRQHVLKLCNRLLVSQMKVTHVFFFSQVVYFSLFSFRLKYSDHGCENKKNGL